MQGSTWPRSPRERRATTRFPTAADWISLSRLPLGAAVWLRPDAPAYVLALMVVAGASDVLDGWVARRAGGGDAGVWLDPLCDKLFILSAVAAVWCARRPPIGLLPLLVSREIVQVATFALMAIMPRLRPRRGFDLRAAFVGKLATVLQFATVAAILFAHPAQGPLAVVTGAVGLVAGTYYARRLYLRARTS
ncbi:MAG: CDP-alcohol phosphatidyltransferase family protein [Planctomycetota bacterium]